MWKLPDELLKKLPPLQNGVNRAPAPVRCVRIQWGRCGVSRAAIATIPRRSSLPTSTVDQSASACESSESICIQGTIRRYSALGRGGRGTSWNLATPSQIFFWV